jgi:hypothetical protein
LMPLNKNMTDPGAALLITQETCIEIEKI